MNQRGNQNDPASQYGQNPLSSALGRQANSLLPEANPAQAATGATAQQAAYTNPASAVSATPASGTPPHIGNSMVDMKLPDGSTPQKVPAVVADAVNRAFNNPNGSDAAAAYGSAYAQATPVDPSNLHTGDVVQWADRSAVIVREGTDNYYIITDGQMRHVDLKDLPNYDNGAFGKFGGFFRPAGAGDPSQQGELQAHAVVQPTTVVSASSTTSTRPPSTDTQET
ncbi:hypothetical protein C8258_16790 [Nocardia sp. MDA0666]|nr:hypothetical protein C8258_16790 [Nocardia sp. MDA0666]